MSATADKARLWDIDELPRRVVRPLLCGWRLCEWRGAEHRGFSSTSSLDKEYLEEGPFMLGVAESIGDEGVRDNGVTLNGSLGLVVGEI